MQAINIDDLLTELGSIEAQALDIEEMAKALVKPEGGNDGSPIR